MREARSRPVRGPAADPVDEPLVRATIVAGVGSLGVALGSDDLDALALHYREMMRWRRRADLTALVDPRSIAVRHYLDSLAVSPWVPRDARIADLGTGAGFPGIPLAIARPDVEVTLLETRDVKLAFLHHVSTLLRRANLRVMRTVDLAVSRRSDPVGLVVARAVASVAEALALSEPLLAHDGEVWLMRGPSKAGEGDAAAKAGWAVAAERRTLLPIEGAVRRLVVYRRTGG